MTRNQYRVLKALNNAKNGKTFDELSEMKGFTDAMDLNLCLSEMDSHCHWIYNIKCDDTQLRISGVGKSALREEQVFRNSYRISIATLIISIVSLIVSLTALILPLLTPIQQFLEILTQ